MPIVISSVAIRREKTRESDHRNGFRYRTTSVEVINGNRMNSRGDVSEDVTCLKCFIVYLIFETTCNIRNDFDRITILKVINDNISYDGVSETTTVIKAEEEQDSPS
mgnify:CR=1 FL=1